MGIFDKVKQLLNPAAASKPDTPGVAEAANPPANPGVQVGEAEAPTPVAQPKTPGAEMPTPPSPATETPVSATSEPDVKG